MSNHRITLRYPAAIEGPRKHGATALGLLHRIGRGVWRALEGAGQRRAARELLATAERMQAYRPDIARLLREAAAFDTRA